MIILIGAEASVVMVNYNKMFGFIRPPSKSPLCDLTGGKDIFFHFDECSMPRIKYGRVVSRKCTEEEILYITSLVQYDEILHFNVSINRGGRFLAKSWTLKSLWGIKLQQLDRAN